MDQRGAFPFFCSLEGVEIEGMREENEMSYQDGETLGEAVYLVYANHSLKGKINISENNEDMEKQVSRLTENRGGKNVSITTGYKLIDVEENGNDWALTYELKGGDPFGLQPLSVVLVRY